jgi:hypothetical protein
VLRVEPGTAGSVLNATHEWNLTASLPAVGANLGLGAISWIPDHPGMMGIEFDRETGYLWPACDDTCQGRSNVLEIQTIAGATDLGRFRVRGILERPSTMPNLNNEGIAIAPEATCSGGQKVLFWTDDGDTGGTSLRGDNIPCGRFLPQ